jgi:hypothetical protein
MIKGKSKQKKQVFLRRVEATSIAGARRLQERDCAM